MIKNPYTAGCGAATRGNKFSSNPSFLPSGRSGYSLIEILVALSISGILLSLAASSLATYKNFVTTTELNELMSDLYYSRSEAIKRQSNITVCRSVDSQNCSPGSGWENGWIVFTDVNRNRIMDTEDKLLLVREALDKNTRLTLGSGYYHYIMYSGSGTAYPRNTFKFCRTGHPPRAIIIFVSGRARISPNNSSGNALEC